MIDVSDGLSRDVGHLCDESGVGVVIEADRVPIHDDARALGARTAAPRSTTPCTTAKTTSCCSPRPAISPAPSASAASFRNEVFGSRGEANVSCSTQRAGSMCCESADE